MDIIEKKLKIIIEQCAKLYKQCNLKCGQFKIIPCIGYNERLYLNIYHPHHSSEISNRSKNLTLREFNILIKNKPDLKEKVESEIERLEIEIEEEKLKQL